MHGLRLSIFAIIPICFCTFLGCRTPTANGDLSTNGGKASSESGGLFSSFTNQFRGNDNTADRSSGIKQASAREAMQQQSRGGTQLAKALTDAPDQGQTSPRSRSRNAEVDGLLGAFDDSSPEVQAAARRLAAARSLRSAKAGAKPNADSPTTGPSESEMIPNLRTRLAQAPAAPLPKGISNSLQEITPPKSESNLTATSPVKTNPTVDGAVRQVSASATEADDQGAVALAAGAQQPTTPQAAETTDAEPATKTIELNQSEPTETPEALTFEEQLAAMITKLESEESESAQTAEGLRRQTALRMLYLLSGKLDDAVKPIDDLSAAEQEYLRHQLMTLWDVTDAEGSPSRGRRWTKALENLQLATSNLAAATETLDVTNIAFCTEVESYGRITPFEEYKFEPGQQVILYCEIDHFAAERLSDGFETHFQGSYDIFNGEGVRVAEQVLPADKKTCNNFRRDYFIAYRLYLPKRLELGAHRIQLTVEDLKGKKYGQAVLDFEVTAKQAAEAAE